jgi:hypothetical protein
MDTDKKLELIEKKLDIVLEELEYQKRKRNELEELKEDLLRVSKDLYSATVYELEEVHDYINTGDVLFLAKKVLRNINNITSLMEKLESVVDLGQDLAPISREMVIDLMHKLDEFDKKGYFNFLSNLSIVTDEVISNLPKERISNFKEYIPNILKIIELASDPTILNKLIQTLETVKDTNNLKIDKISTTQLTKELLSQDTKIATYKLLQILKSFK